ncbi:MAG: hypothetical protein ACI9Y1_002775 [Lentisphaeria bacterium]|jgi:hypothetical protein
MIVKGLFKMETLIMEIKKEDLKYGAKKRRAFKWSV